MPRTKVFNSLKNYSISLDEVEDIKIRDIGQGNRSAGVRKLLDAYNQRESLIDRIKDLESTIERLEQEVRKESVEAVDITRLPMYRSAIETNAKPENRQKDLRIRVSDEVKALFDIYGYNNDGLPNAEIFQHILKSLA